jgi:hypothetical protein
VPGLRVHLVDGDVVVHHDVLAIDFDEQACTVTVVGADGSHVYDVDDVEDLVTLD